MNKNGKMNGLWILAIGVIALFALGVIKLPQGSTSGGVEPLPDGSCQLAPSITNSTIDAANLGTAVTTTSTLVRVNGIYRGTSIPSSFAYGDSGEIIFDATGYLAQKVDFGPLGCGVNTVVGKLYANGSTVKVFNDVGTVVTDSVSGGATNQSSSATVVDQEIKFTAGSDQSTGDLVCVIEATATSNVSTMVISGATKVNVPKFYSIAGATSVAEAYEIPALLDGNSKTYNLKITPESGVTMNDVGFYFTCYAKQWFVDTDGTFKYGVEDTDGTSKSQTDFDYDWFMT